MTLDERLLRAQRLSDESKKERQQKFEEYVKQMGFTSVEAYQEDQSAKERAGLEARSRKLDEKCALLGKTREQLQAEMEAEDPQRWIPDCWMPECDCEDHPIPFFCPHSLVDYNSMDSQNFPLTRYLQEQKRARIEDIRIQPGDESSRLSHRALEYYWKTEDMPADIPLWAKKDKVLEHMISPSHSTKVDIQLLSPELSGNGNAVAEMDVGKMQPQPELPRRLPNASPLSQTPLAERGVRSRGLTAPSAGAKGHTKAFRSGVSRRHKKRLATSGAIQKFSQRQAMRTRSHKSTEFFELDLDGLPLLRSYSHPA